MYDEWENEDTRIEAFGEKPPMFEGRRKDGQFGKVQYKDQFGRDYSCEQGNRFRYKIPKNITHKVTTSANADDYRRHPLPEDPVLVLNPLQDDLTSLRVKVSECDYNNWKDASGYVTFKFV